MTQFNSLLPIRGSRNCYARNVWAFIKQVFTRCFPSYGAWLNQLLKVKWSVQSISASQSLMTNQYLSIDAIQSRRRISSRHFLFSHNPSQFNIFNSRERSFLFKERRRLIASYMIFYCQTCCLWFWLRFFGIYRKLPIWKATKSQS